MPTFNLRDDVFELFTDRFDVSEIVAKCIIRYQGKEKGEEPKRDYWVRISTSEVGSPQVAFAMTPEPDASPSVYESFGLVFVQVFAPMSEEDSFHNGDLIAKAARDIFRRVETPSGVTFRNARFNELDNDGKFYRWNVKVEYEYTERKG